MKQTIAAIVVTLAALLVGTALAAKKSNLQVEVVSSDTREYKYKGGGLIGMAVGSKTRNEVFAMNTIIDKEHVKLECKENHSNCTAMTPGVYVGEFDGKSIWLDSTVPLTHKAIRQHWAVSGGW